jgi:alkanesulfonate monooxygenase SsuD/methylene tetrahydromethanopterin reductase-like flavin-dependent oxidoreductase (luciferase family)
VSNLEREFTGVTRNTYTLLSLDSSAAAASFTITAAAAAATRRIQLMQGRETKTAVLPYRQP